MKLTEEAVLWVAITVVVILVLAALICFMVDKPIAGMCIGAIPIGILLLLAQMSKGDY